MISTKKIGSVIALVVGLAMVLSLVIGVGTASALTAADIDLLAALGIISADKVATAKAALGVTTTTTTSGYTFTKSLTVGSRGADVTALQNMLGVSPATGYFGSITKAAVIKYQLQKGISPAAGYVGPKTIASLNGAGSSTGGTVVIPTGTDLTVSLAPTSPASSAIVAGQAAADLVEYTFTNRSATPAVVTNVTLARGGVSADTALSNVYLYNGATRLTDAATVSSGKITFNASAGLFSVGAGASVTIAVKADIAAGTSGQLVVISLTGVTSNVPVSAVYPISGASQNIFSSSDIAQATSTISGSAYTDGTRDIQAGSLNQTVWGSNLSLSGRAVYLKSLAVKVIGSIPTNSLQNIKLYVSGIQVGAAAGVDSNGMVTFDLSGAPYKIDSSRTIEVRADVMNGSSRTFSVSLQNASDLQIIDSNYNVGIAVALSGSQSSDTFTVSVGSVTATQDTSLAAGDVVTGSANIPLARYTLKAYGEDMKISYLYASSTQAIDNVSLFANGIQIGSTQTLSSAYTAKLFNLGSSLIIPAGQSVTLEIRGDAKYNGTNLATSSSLKVALTGYANNAQGSYSSQLITVPSSTIDGPIMSIKGAGLTLAANSAVSNYSTVPNTSVQRLGSFILQSSAAEAVRVTGLTVTLGGAAGATTNVSNLYVSVGGVNSTPVSPQSSNNFSVDFTVAANSTKVIDIYGDLSSVTGVATTTLALNGYGVSSNITVEKAAVVGQTVTVGSGSLAVPTLLGGSNTVDPQFVLGGTTNNLIAYYNFVSTYGTSNISEMYFDASGTTANITSITVGGVNVPMVSGSATVTGLNIPISVISGGVKVPVYVTYSSVGTSTGGVVSNNTVGLKLTGYKYTSGNNTVSTTTLAVASNDMTLVASKPTLALNAPANTLLSNGTTVLGSVSVAADSRGAIALTNLPLTIATSSVTTASYTVKVNGVAVSGATASATGVSFSSAYRIDAGTSVTFEIGATVSGLVIADGGSVSLSLGSAASLTWDDIMGGVSAITGSAIYNYPTGSVSVSR